MIIYSEGTVFNAGTQAVVNTVNCTGVMGAGIALEFMLRYPEMFEDYEVKCKDKRIITGKVDYFKNGDGSMIINFPTKWHFKYPSKLIWIEQGLLDFAKTYSQKGITSVAFPKLGTSNGGLNWSEVQGLMEKYLSDLDVDVYICLDNKKDAEGIEKTMLDEFNSTSIEQISSIVKLNSKQRENIHKRIPYNRFWKISETESVGMKTYSMIFRYFYELALGNNQEDIQKNIQLSFFDL